MEMKQKQNAPDKIPDALTNTRLFAGI